MNIMFLCMGRMLDVYYDSSLEISSKLGINSTFYISDRKHFSKFQTQKPNFESTNTFLSEWSITDKVSNHFNIEELNRIENKYFNDNSIWEPLVADRRVFMGNLCKYTQDYKPSYSYEEMMSLMIEGIQSIENFLDLHKPNIIIGFTIATFGEYLIALIAKERGIKFIQLRHSKIKNYYTFSSDLHEKYEKIRENYSSKDSVDAHKNIIDNYIEDIKKKGMVYEGTIDYSGSFVKALIQYPKYFIFSLINDIKYLRTPKDNHYRASLTKIFFYDKFFRFLRNSYQTKILKKYYLQEKSLTELNYVFFPLHAEPEIAISIFSMHYQNQIEVIRNISLSLPANFKLIVKEHPRNIGRRKTTYYKKILQIPNVNLVDPGVNPSYIISHSKLVIVLSGFLAFEALMAKIPVISLGSAMYNMLPKTLINHVDNIKNLRKELIFSLNNFSYNEITVKKYLDAIISNSERLDLYTVLLKKIGRSGGSNFSDELYKKNILALTSLINKELDEIKD